MDSNLFGSGVPKFAVGEDEISIDNSFIESIELEPRDIEHESIINTNRNWSNKAAHDHIAVIILCRLHKISGPLEWFKDFYNNYNKTEVNALFPSQTADAFADENGEVVKFRMQITELFPLETPWAYDTFRMIFRSKKPVDLLALLVTTGSGIVQIDSSQIAETDTDQVAQTD